MEEGSHVARAPRALVEGASILAALDEAAHGAVANLDGHVIDDGVLRQREGVEGFDVLGRGVGEDLGHRDASEEPADAGAHVGVLERARALQPAVSPGEGEARTSCCGPTATNSKTARTMAGRTDCMGPRT